MVRIGITGQSGFIGTHLFNYLSILKGEVALVPFFDEFFNSREQLNSFVKGCDVIVHLAALNRHNEAQQIYNTNIGLVKAIIKSCEETGSRPHILFSSSTQEERNNPYGNSKREGRTLFEEWARRNNASFTGLIIPNVFGPFGNPFYNSVIATFCHQLTHNEQPHIDVNGEIKLIYVGELVQTIFEKIKAEAERVTHYLGNSSQTAKDSDGTIELVNVANTSQKMVSEILGLLIGFKENYFEKGIFPNLNDNFEKNLFNTFVCYIDHELFFPFFLTKNTDERGTYVETVKMNSGGQISFSTTKPGITRGNHYHTRKAERFAVIKGKARIDLRKISSDKVLSFELDGNNPSFVDMPVWFTHNITNIGTEDVYTIFWINEFYNPNDPDTYFEKV